MKNKSKVLGMFKKFVRKIKKINSIRILRDVLVLEVHSTILIYLMIFIR